MLTPVGQENVKTAACLVIGNEILSGKVAEANVVELARLLRSRGIEFRRVVMIEDDLDLIAREVKELSSSHTWLFTSGGVGPTHDDVTVEGVARAFGRKVLSSPELESMIRAHYKERTTDGHLRMALIPEGAELAVTEQVKWPTLRVENTWLLPGVPQIFALKLQVVAAHIGDHGAFVSHAVYTQMDEGDLKALLDSVVAQFPNIFVGSYPKWLDPTYKTKLTFDGRNAEEVARARDAFIALLPKGEPQRVE
jgi:molybdopterin-biosynthesis enzyme MoeA-like protein